MSWDWRSVRDHKLMAAQQATEKEGSGTTASHAAGASSGENEMIWHPLQVDRAGRARGSRSPAGRLLHDGTYQCAFCRGEGERPVGTICPVCRRSGVISLEPPVVACGYCHGRGEVPPRSGVTCLVCRGKGKVSVKEPVRVCPACRGRGRKIGAALYCIQCRGVGMVCVKAHGGGRSSRESVLPSECEVLDAVAEGGGCCGKTAIGRSMGLSSLYADQLCIKLAGKGLVKERERGVYALTDSGNAAVSKSAAAHTTEVQDV